jgi:hypothetical protein
MIVFKGMESCFKNIFPCFNFGMKESGVMDKIKTSGRGVFYGFLLKERHKHFSMFVPVIFNLL